MNQTITIACEVERTEGGQCTLKATYRWSTEARRRLRRPPGVRCGVHVKDLDQRLPGMRIERWRGMSLDREQKQDHLVDMHKFDDVPSLGDTDDDMLDIEHVQAHRVTQLIWTPHTHPQGGWS